MLFGSILEDFNSEPFFVHHENSKFIDPYINGNYSLLINCSKASKNLSRCLAELVQEDFFLVILDF